MTSVLFLEVKICTEIYGTEALELEDLDTNKKGEEKTVLCEDWSGVALEAVQRAVKENIVVASRAEQGQAPATAPSTGGYTSGTMAPAAGAHTKELVLNESKHGQNGMCLYDFVFADNKRLQVACPKLHPIEFCSVWPPWQRGS